MVWQVRAIISLDIIAFAAISLSPSNLDANLKAELLATTDYHINRQMLKRLVPREVQPNALVSAPPLCLSLTPSLPCLLYGYTGWPERGGTEHNGMGPARSSSLSDTSLPLLYCYTGWPGRDRTEQEGTGPPQAAAATGSTQAATATREGPGRGGNGYVCWYFLFLFL